MGDLRLPEPFTFPPSSESPGAVTFDHESHVDASAPQCASCHASLFRINQPGRPVTGELTYESIHEGPLCASCHDGESAFDIQDACDACHGGE
jgi:c(7)-type cytochrome triheme protein